MADQFRPNHHSGQLQRKERQSTALLCVPYTAVSGGTFGGASGIPKRCALNDDLDSTGERVILCESVIDFDSLVVAVDFELGDDLVRLTLFK